MPIYAYRCQSCGFAKDILQKMSDDVLTICPECNQSSFQKQVTAAGFQLKGSGWYVTDFRDGAKNTNSNNSNSTNAKTTETTTSKTENSSSDVKSTSAETQVASTSTASTAGSSSTAT